jgi:hypothetical protein
VPIKRLVVLLVILFILPVGVYLALNVTNFWQRAFGTPANLVIDAGSSVSYLGSVWQNLGQGGEEKGRMLESVAPQLRSLAPKYIRIDHVFDSYEVVSRGGDGQLVFDWSKLDLTLGDIKAARALPFISVSYMPPVISKSDIVDVPRDWGEWELVVQRLVEHISGTRGLNLAGVYYEVWNEPDLFGGFKVYGEKNYLDLYLHTENGATRAKGVNYFEIGGPATTALYKNWFDGLLKFVDQNNLRLDFFSWHKYSKNLDNYEDDIASIKNWLTAYPKYSAIELIISEIGPNSENDPVYDGNFSAIHTLATSAILEGNINKSILFEIKDGPGDKQFWGRWGILTHEKYGNPSVKPRFRAIQFLNQMDGNKITVTGQGSWVKAFAKEKNSVIRVLVVNYDGRGSHYEAVPITFTNLPSGNFTFRRIDFGGGIRETQVATTSSTWATLEGLNANSASIFELQPR